LGVLAGWRADAHIAFDVPPQAFTPQPKVTSSVVCILPRANPLPTDAARLAKVTEAAFGQRRKMLRQSLKALGGELLLRKAGIDGTRRAETLSVDEFVRLANAIASVPSHGSGRLLRLLCEQPCNEILQAGAAFAPQSLGSDDGADRRKGAVEIVVHDDVVIVAPLLDL